jgi:hypothetical protein
MAVIGNYNMKMRKWTDIVGVGMIERIGGDIVMKRMRKRMAVLKIDVFGEY